MLNRATALLNFADADAQFQRRYCSISPAEALNFNAVCKKRYGSKRLDNACERVLRLTSQPTVRNISVLCKSSAEKQPDRVPVKKEGVTEQLKADNQMLWVAKMNNIRNCAEEIVNAELIYT